MQDRAGIGPGKFSCGFHPVAAWLPPPWCTTLCTASSTKSLLGLADRREDNGDAKVTEEYEAEMLTVVPGFAPEARLPQAHLDPGTADPCSSQADGIPHQPHHNEPPAQAAANSPWSAQAHRRLPLEKTPENEAVAGNPRVDRDLAQGRSRSFTWTKWISISIPRSGRIGCCGARKRPSSRQARTRNGIWPGRSNARTGRLTWVEADRKNSQLFILQLWQLVGRDYPQAKRIHLILDNYRIHSSLQTQAALARLDGRVVLHFLPPYCPDHNRIDVLARPSRQCHPQPPVPHHERTDDGGLSLAQETKRNATISLLPEESCLSLLESRKAI